MRYNALPFFHSKDMNMKQFSKRIAVTHWLVFLLIIAALSLGLYLDASENTAQKLSLFPAHFLIGDTILLLTLLRIYFRKKDGEPAPANKNPMLNKLAAFVHYGLNISVIAVAVSGIVTVVTSGVLKAISAKDPGLIPDFGKVDAKEFHELFLAITVFLLAIHIAAAIYHQFLVKDNLMRRIMIKRFPD
jgi:cytochrome b561